MKKQALIILLSVSFLGTGCVTYLQNPANGADMTPLWTPTLEEIQGSGKRSLTLTGWVRGSGNYKPNRRDDPMNAFDVGYYFAGGGTVGLHWPLFQNKSDGFLPAWTWGAFSVFGGGYYGFEGFGNRMGIPVPRSKEHTSFGWSSGLEFSLGLAPTSESGLGVSLNNTVFITHEMGPYKAFRREFVRLANASVARGHRWIDANPHDWQINYESALNLNLYINPDVLLFLETIYLLEFPIGKRIDYNALRYGTLGFGVGLRVGRFSVKAESRSDFPIHTWTQLSLSWTF